mmetsp:Transcript_34226/g.75943  ORF Transcript_34226/g.75943 Transcript_34226/m.75943 type:complete len:307 (+) Transcript_34226:1102-2022(+)
MHPLLAEARDELHEGSADVCSTRSSAPPTLPATRHVIHQLLDRCIQAHTTDQEREGDQGVEHRHLKAPELAPEQAQGEPGGQGVCTDQVGGGCDQAHQGAEVGHSGGDSIGVGHHKHGGGQPVLPRVVCRAGDFGLSCGTCRGGSRWLVQASYLGVCIVTELMRGGCAAAWWAGGHTAGDEDQEVMGPHVEVDEVLGGGLDQDASGREAGARAVAQAENDDPGNGRAAAPVAYSSETSVQQGHDGGTDAHCAGELLGLPHGAHHLHVRKLAPKRKNHVHERHGCRDEVVPCDLLRGVLGIRAGVHD